MTEEIRVKNDATGGEKGQKLDRFDLIPAESLRQIARHFGEGAKKYADRNWERGYNWDLSFGALMRHMWAWWGGEDIDEETGSSHLAAAGFHVLALLEFERTHPELDTRPTTVARREAVEVMLNPISGRIVSGPFTLTVDGTSLADEAMELFWVDLLPVAEPINPDDFVEVDRPGPEFYVGQVLESHDQWDVLPVGTVLVWTNGGETNFGNQATKREDGLWVDRWNEPQHAIEFQVHWQIESLPGLEPKYQVGERVSVRDAMKALEGTRFITNTGRPVVLTSRALHEDTVTFLDALEDAGFQVTKA